MKNLAHCTIIKWGGGLRALDQRPALGTILGPPTVSLRTSTSHQERLFPRIVSLHNLMCTDKFTQTGAALTVFTVFFVSAILWIPKNLNSKRDLCHPDLKPDIGTLNPAQIHT